MTRDKSLTDLTFCIPLRIDSYFRYRNFMAVLRFYSKSTNAKFIVLEADRNQHINKLPLIKNLTYKFVLDKNPIFHRTHYINKMLSEVKTNFAAIWDADAIAPIKQVITACEKLNSDGLVMVYPYDGRFWEVNDFLSQAFCKKLSLRYLINPFFVKYPLCKYSSVGGAFLVDVRKYKCCGWENENFVGWGPEDLERYHRLEILGFKPGRVSGSLYHLYHSRGINSGLYDINLMMSTKREYIHVCGMEPDELNEYIRTWDWIHDE